MAFGTAAFGAGEVFHAAPRRCGGSRRVYRIG